MTRAAPISDALFPPAEQIIDAPDHAMRAAILLRLSDAVILTYTEALVDACLVAKFDEGAMFVNTRAAALTSTRRIDGRLRDDVAHSLAFARAPLLLWLIAERRAEETTSSSPTGRTNRASRVARPAASFSGGA